MQILHKPKKEPLEFYLTESGDIQAAIDNTSFNLIFYQIRVFILIFIRVSLILRNIFLIQKIILRIIDMEDYNNDSKLENTLVAYSDILGFKNYIIEDLEKPNYQDFFTKKIVQLNKTLYNQHKQLLKNIGKYSGKVAIFSDNIFIRVPIIPELSHMHQIFNPIKIMAIYQSMLAINGFFIRGGICAGDSYYDGDLMIGPAIINAVTLEQTVAIYPRIIIESTLFDTYIKPKLDDKTDLYNNRLNHYLIKDTEGNWFINYLYYLFEHMMEISGFNDEYIDNNKIEEAKSVFNKDITIHKNVIEFNINKYEKEKDILSKFLWLSEYHNFFCNTYFDSEMAKELMIIEEKKSPISGHYNKINSMKSMFS